MKLVFVSLLILTLVAKSHANSIPKSFLAEVWQIHDNVQVKQEGLREKVKLTEKVEVTKKVELFKRGSVVVLIEDIVILLTIKGKNVGHMTLKSGRKVEVFADYHNKLDIKVGDIISKIDKKSVKVQIENVIASR